jgi:hypothetical protein
MSEHRTSASPGVSKYYDALNEVFALEGRVLTAVIPHMGERGSNDEERCRAFLARVLPRRYSIGTGFIVSAEPDAPPSPQQDIVIFDGFNNSPLHAELSASVYPVEMVYATMEVKGFLDRAKLRDAITSIGRVRALSMRGRYLQLQPRESPPGRYTPMKFKSPIKRPPTGLIFAYDTSYESLDRFQQALQEVIDEVGTAHLHGIVVVKHGWFAFQEPYKSPAMVRVYGDNGLMRFVTSMLTLLRATYITPAAMDEYLRIDTAPPEGDGENPK